MTDSEPLDQHEHIPQSTTEPNTESEDVHMEDAKDQSDEEYVEESYYVVANVPADLWSLRKNMPTEDGTPAASKFAIIGLETETPMLEIDGVVCEGAYDELLGTSVVFEAEQTEEDDEEEDAQVSAEPIAVTSKVINFQTIKIELRSI